MKYTNTNISQNKLELMVAVGFSIIIIIMSNTKLGYIPISNHRSLDAGIICAIFAAMIGGYRVGIPVSLIWAFCAFTNDASHLQTFTLLGLIAERLLLVVAAIESYKWFRRKYVASPANVYRALLVAITVKNIVANLILLYVLIYVEQVFMLSTWVKYTAEIYLLEVALTSLAMKLLIGHLREVHILNGVKRREKAKALAKSKSY